MPPLKRTVSEFYSQPVKVARVETSKKVKTKTKKTPLTMKLPYSEGARTTIAASGVVERIFRGNGMYDPDVALGGHQPLGFDQLHTLYVKNYVKGSRISVKIVPGSLTGYGCYLAVWPDVSSSSYSAADFTSGKIPEICTRQGGRIVPIMANKGADISLSRSTSTMVGKKDDDQYGTASGDPIDLWYWHVMIVNTDTGGTMNISDRCIVNYDAEFSEPKVETQS